MPPKRLYIVDAMAMAFRAFYAFGMSGRGLTTAAGLPVSAVYGSAIFMNKLIAELKPDYLAIACDSREPTFRHELYPAYKANRAAMPEDLAAQMPAFLRLLAAYGAPVLRQPGLEADDLIGSLVRQFAGPELHCYIVSGDKDFMQLVGDHVYLYTPKKDEAQVIDSDGVRAKFGVDPSQVVDCLALIGDTSDNVPGVHGIGEKGAAKLIAEHGSLDQLYAGLDAVTNKKHRSCLEAGRDQAFFARELVTIRTDVELPVTLANLVCDPLAATANTALLHLFHELEFRGLAARVQSGLSARGAAVVQAAALPHLTPLGFPAITPPPGAPPPPGVPLAPAAAPAALTPPLGASVPSPQPGLPAAPGATAVPILAALAGPGVAALASAPALTPLGFPAVTPPAALLGAPVLAEAPCLAPPGIHETAPGPTPAQRLAASAPGYRLVNTASALADLVRTLSAEREFCFDTETTGLDLVKDRPIGISLAVTPGEAYYVPLAAQHLVDLTPEAALALLTPVLKAEGRLKVGHNLKFDLQMLANAGVVVAGPFVDTMLCDWLLDAGGRQHGLDACCLRHLQYEKIPTSALIGPKGETPMLDVNLDLLTRYACEDADLTLKLYRHLIPRIVDAGLGPVLRDIEMPLVPVLARMERTGVHIDLVELAQLGQLLTAQSRRLETDVYALAGGEFNLNSPKQLSELLFTTMKVHEALGVKHLRKTATGFSTDESVLSRLAAHPLPRALLEYRSVTKLKGTYVDALPTLVNSVSHRLHTSLHQTGTATGRLSSSEPNLQNIPVRSPLGREIRKAFRPAELDWVILAADYSQIELRLLAHLAGEAALTRAFAERQDVHATTAALVFGVPLAEVDQTMRSRAKAINFGIIYGMGARRLAAETGSTLAEAAAFINSYFASYPGIRKFIDATVASARASGEVRTITGRRRAIPGLSATAARAPGGSAASENMAVNTRIQGSAADLIKLAMIAVDRDLGRAGLHARLLLQVHDELVLECPRTEIEKTTALVRTCMENAMRLSVPLDVTVGFGAHWLEAH